MMLSIFGLHYSLWALNSLLCTSVFAMLQWKEIVNNVVRKSEFGLLSRLKRFVLTLSSHNKHFLDPFVIARAMLAT